jgi:hypothetical protein
MHTAPTSVLTQSYGRTPKSTASSTTMLMTARSAGLQPWHRPTSVLKDHLLCSLSPVSGRSQATRLRQRCAGLLKSP